MNYGELKAEFLAILNRSDAVEADAVRYLDNALRRMQRRLRIGCMERELIATAPPEYLTGVAIPNNYLAMKEVYWRNEGNTQRQTLRFIPYRQWITAQAPGIPLAYTRFGPDWLIAPWAAENDTVSFWYYGEFSAFENDADDNEISLIAPETVIYGALSAGSERFRHPKGADWEARFLEGMQSLEDQENDEALHQGPMQVTPAYGASDWS